ncbi:hypothetical protein GW17_00010123 [Ensete ventricosum]|nr:hypothetical protein GW17_00010123 [Ensete ventricosum]
MTCHGRLASMLSYASYLRRFPKGTRCHHHPSRRRQRAAEEHSDDDACALLYLQDDTRQSGSSSPASPAPASPSSTSRPSTPSSSLTSSTPLSPSHKTGHNPYNAMTHISREVRAPDIESKRERLKRNKTYARTRGASNAFNVGVCMQPVPKDAQRWRAIPELHEPRAPPVPAARQIDRSHMAYLIMRLSYSGYPVTNSSSGGRRFHPPPPACCVPWLPARDNVIAFCTHYGRMLGRHVSCLQSISRNLEVWARLARGAGSPVCLCWVESKAADRILTGRRPPPELPCPFPINADPKTGSRQFPVSLICS